jgi:hypothetical protein
MLHPYALLVHASADLLRQHVGRRANSTRQVAELVRRVWWVAAAFLSGVALTACSPSSSTATSTTKAKTAEAPNTVPAKAEVVDGVPLVPITVAQLADCDQFANQLRRQVPCPGLLPDPIPVSPTSSAASCLGELGEDGCGPAVIQLDGGVFLLSQSNFQVPHSYVGVTFQQYSGKVVPMTSVNGGPLGHFVFMTGTDLQSYMRQEPGKGLPPVPAYCSLMKLDKPIRVHGAMTALYQCSDSSNGPGLELIMGHDVLVWNDAGITCEVSFHGHSQVNVDLDGAIADATQLVSPTKR